MDIQAYIESGILEQYVLHLLSDQERTEVEQVLAKYPEIKAELNAIEAALQQYAEADALPLREGFAQDVLHKIDELAAAETAKTKSSPSKVEPSNSILTWVLIGLLIASLIGLFYIFNQWQESQADLAEIQHQLSGQEASCDSLGTRIQILEQQLPILRDPNTQTIQMENLGKAPNAQAYIWYQAVENKTFLDIKQFPAIADASKQYQLWAIVNGTPVSMGVFDLDAGNQVFVEVPFIQNAEAFAISLEDKGGVDVPTDIYVLGTVS